MAPESSHSVLHHDKRLGPVPSPMNERRYAQSAFQKPPGRFPLVATGLIRETAKTDRLFRHRADQNVM